MQRGKVLIFVALSLLFLWALSFAGRLIRTGAGGVQKLNDLEDVSTSGVSDNEVLTYDAASGTFDFSTAGAGDMMKADVDDSVAAGIARASIADLSDVDTTGVADNYVLSYVKASNSFDFAAAGAGDMMRADFKDSLDNHVSTYGYSFIDDANEAALKATLNLEAGTDYNAYSADMDTDSTDDMLLASMDDTLSVYSVRLNEYRLPAYSAVGDSSYAGKTTTLIAGYTTKIGDCVYIASADGRLELTGKDAEATTGDIGVYIVLESGITDGNSVLCLIEGWMRYDSKYEFAVGAAVFIGDDGLPTTTQSTTAGDFLRIIGHASPDADIFYFDPDYDWLEIQ